MSTDHGAVESKFHGSCLSAHRICRMSPKKPNSAIRKVCRAGALKSQTPQALLSDAATLADATDSGLMHEAQLPRQLCRQTVQKSSFNFQHK